MSYRPHGASDIVPGSRWSSARGPGCAFVSAVGGGYVVFVYADGAVVARERLHHQQFREQFVEPYDSREVRSKFSMYLANLSEFHAFWCCATKKMFARSTTRSPKDAHTAARGSPALPPGVILVGTYSEPFKPDVFLADLNDAIAGSSHSAAA